MVTQGGDGGRSWGRSCDGVAGGVAGGGGECWEWGVVSYLGFGSGVGSVSWGPIRRCHGGLRGGASMPQEFPPPPSLPCSIATLHSSLSFLPLAPLLRNNQYFSCNSYWAPSSELLAGACDLLHYVESDRSCCKLLVGLVIYCVGKW
ncbi:hypothetical protein M758_8G086200 [Ceratodon purpureus]|nr:hypothetical protein M758_8G086200 [Ceratodon purpureus]